MNTYLHGSTLILLHLFSLRDKDRQIDRCREKVRKRDGLIEKSEGASEREWKGRETQRQNIYVCERERAGVGWGGGGAKTLLGGFNHQSKCKREKYASRSENGLFRVTAWLFAGAKVNIFLPFSVY